MIISISKSLSPEGWAHKYFTRINVLGVKQFCSIITKYHWAGITWKNDQRSQENYESCQLCVLDFDEGDITMSGFSKTARELGYWFIVGPSKSHQKEKNGVICDRFRAVLKFSEPILDAEQYKQNMKRIQKCFRSDWQATGGHMKFAPCTSIYDLNIDGDLTTISVHPKKVYTTYRTAEDYVSMGDKSVPSWLTSMLVSVDKGQRNITVFKAAKTLQKRKFSQTEVFSIVKNTGVDLEDREIKNTIHSAFKR